MQPEYSTVALVVDYVVSLIEQAPHAEMFSFCPQHRDVQGIGMLPYLKSLRGTKVTGTQHVRANVLKDGAVVPCDGMILQMEMFEPCDPHAFKEEREVFACLVHLLGCYQCMDESTWLAGWSASAKTTMASLFGMREIPPVYLIAQLVRPLRGTIAWRDVNGEDL